MDVSDGLTRDGMRDARVLIFSGGEEMMGEVLLWIGRCSPCTHVPRDSGGGEHKSKEAEGRDVNENVHACFKKDNKGRRFVQLIRSRGGELTGYLKEAGAIPWVGSSVSV